MYISGSIKQKNKVQILNFDKLAVKKKNPQLEIREQTVEDIILLTCNENIRRMNHML
jgi:nucleoid DNA-binding protein